MTYTLVARLHLFSWSRAATAARMLPAFTRRPQPLELHSLVLGLVGLRIICLAAPLSAWWIISVRSRVSSVASARTARVPLSLRVRCRSPAALTATRSRPLSKTTAEEIEQDEEDPRFDP